MLRRAFCKALGAMGLGGGIAAGSIIRHPFDLMAGEHKIGTAEAIEAVDMGVFSIRIGDKVTIYVNPGGTLNVPDGLGAAKVHVAEGGTMVMGKGAFDG